MTRNPVDFTKETYFYDDRDEYDYMYRLEKVLYQDDTVCLCEAVCTDAAETATEKFLVDIKSGEVFNSDYDSWITTNDVEWALPEIERMKQRAADANAYADECLAEKEERKL